MSNDISLETPSRRRFIGIAAAALAAGALSRLAFAEPAQAARKSRR